MSPPIQNSDSHSESSQNMRSLNPTLLLSEFTGSDSSDVFMFFDQFDAAAKMGLWSEEEKIVILKSRLREKAQKFVASSPETRLEKSYEILKKKIIEFFDNSPSLMVRQQMFTKCHQNHGESIRELAHRVSANTRTYLNGSTDAPQHVSQQVIDSLSLSKFLDALQPHLRVETMKQAPKDFKQAVEIATNIQQALDSLPETPVMQISSQQELNVEHELAIQKDINREILDRLQALNITIKEIENSKQQTHNAAAPNPQPTTKFCLYCGKNFHTMMECRVLARDNSQKFPTRNQDTYQRTPVQNFRGRGQPRGRGHFAQSFRGRTAMAPSNANRGRNFYNSGNEFMRNGMSH